MSALQLSALLAYGGFLLVTFGWQALKAKRTNGQSQWRKPVSSTDAGGEVACLVGCALSLVAPALALTGIVEPIADGWLALRAVTAVVCMAGGLVIAVSAQHHLAREWRAGVEASASLVTTGPYARVRNPFYLGCFLASAAVAIAVPSAVALGGFLLHVAAAEVIVRAVEEPILSQAHGQDFALYKRRTGRFLPRLVREDT